jgi:hypothetical protein
MQNEPSKRISTSVLLLILGVSIGVIGWAVLRPTAASAQDNGASEPIHPSILHAINVALDFENRELRALPEAEASSPTQIDEFRYELEGCTDWSEGASSTPSLTPVWIIKVSGEWLTMDVESPSKVTEFEIGICVDSGRMMYSFYGVSYWEGE